MAAKAVIIVDPSGAPLHNVEATLVMPQRTAAFPLTNDGGYALSQFGWHAESGYLKVVANGYVSYIQPLTLDNDNQNIFVGAPSTDPNAIILPPLQKAGSSFPKNPTRDEVCNVFSGFQGISILTKQFGWIPAFGPECGALNDEDTISYCQQMREKTFTHVEFDISWQYNEPSFQYPVPGMDLAYNLDEACRRIELMIRQGMFVKMSLSGDGFSVNPNPAQGEYNDPYGWTYGFEWLINNQARIIEALSNYNGHDLTRFIIFFPGYDGVFYGWGKEGEVPDHQPDRVCNWGNSLRAIRSDLYIGIEHTEGTIPVGEGDADWVTGGRMDWCDTLASEFNPFNYHKDSTWQIVGRFARPFNRPSDMPDGDDPNPPFYLHDCSRGKRFYIMYEVLTYRSVRGEVGIVENNEAFDYFHTMAPETTLCMIRQ